MLEIPFTVVDQLTPYLLVLKVPQGTERLSNLYDQTPEGHGANSQKEHEPSS